MPRFSRKMWLAITVCVLISAASSLWLIGCNATKPAASLAFTQELVRVRLLENVDHVILASSSGHRLDIGMQTDGQLRAANIPQQIRRQRDEWVIDGHLIPGTLLSATASANGYFLINQTPYRGSVRIVATGPDRFDLINDVDVESYLKGVLPRELFRDWHIETYKAQAIVARTYALYHTHMEGLGRSWDVYPDQRSQVYGGMAAETSKSAQAVDETSGLVLTYGPGEGKLFEAYFSSCCGGVSQAAVDVFPGSPAIPPLAARDNRGECTISPHYNWGPVRIEKSELTRRIKFWALKQNKPRPEANMPTIASLNVYTVNVFGRPTRFRATDSAGAVYLWPAEEMRSAANTDAPTGSTLPSSFCQAASSGTAIVFYDGHGFGHGVGMCQWCAQASALAGRTHLQILTEAYPQARLVRAY